MRKKADLPSKPCAACGRPFTWRKKWAKVWDEVRYCSDRCRGEGRSSKLSPAARPEEPLKRASRRTPPVGARA